MPQQPEARATWAGRADSVGGLFIFLLMAGPTTWIYASDRNYVAVLVVLAALGGIYLWYLQKVLLGVSSRGVIHLRGVRLRTIPLHDVVWAEERAVPHWHGRRIPVIHLAGGRELSFVRLTSQPGAEVTRIVAAVNAALPGSASRQPMTGG